jgi:hypothetical protein
LFSGGVEPPIPPNSPPRALIGESEDETEVEGELEEGRQLIILNPHPISKTNTNQKNNQPWLVPDAIVVARALHDMPKHLKFLPKFAPDKKYFVEDHIKKLMLVVRLMDVQYEDVFCILFPYMFENKASI